MKRLFTLIIIFTISCKDQSKRIENDLYSCLTSSLSQDEKTKLDLIVADFESHLIEKGILQSADPESYYNVYKDLANTEDYDFTNEFSFSEKISFLNRKKPE